MALNNLSLDKTFILFGRSFATEGFCM